MITRTIETMTFTVALYSYLDGAACETVERTFIGDEKKARREIDKEFGKQPHEVIHVDRAAKKYAMSVEEFIDIAEEVK